MRALIPALLMLTACDAPNAQPSAPAYEAGSLDTQPSAPETDSAEPEPEPEPERLTAAHFSPVAQQIIAAMSHYGSEGATFSVTGDATVSDGWLLQTPQEPWGVAGAALPQAVTCDSGPGCDEDFGLRLCSRDSDCGDTGQCAPVAASVTTPGEAPTTMCTGHSDAFYDELYLALTEAEDYADLSSLDTPDGRFLAALRNAVSYLDAAGADAQVRVLFGQIPGLSMDPDTIVADLTRDIGEDTSLTVSVGAYRDGYTSWNHSKIVAVDGRLLLQGGHNLWDTDYLKGEPVFDLSMRTDGSSALTAHRFLDRLWSYTCGDHTVTGYTERASFPAGSPDCPAEIELEEPAQWAGSGHRVISAGRLGAVGEDPADAGILAALGAAEHTLRLAIQDLGPIRLVGDLSLSDWPREVMTVLTDRMLDGVDIYMVVSNPGSTPGGGSNAYGNGWTAEELAQAMEAHIEESGVALPSGMSARALLCERLNVAPLRYHAAEPTWPNGENVGNHAKSFIIDDAVFYIGSQNLYVADLAEFGLFIDDEELTDELIADYWAPMWAASRSAAVSGADTGSCTF